MGNTSAPAFEPEKWNLDKEAVQSFQETYGDLKSPRPIEKYGQREFAVMFKSGRLEDTDVAKSFGLDPGSERFAQFKQDATNTYGLDKEQPLGIDRANCYGYARNDMDPVGSVGSQHPAETISGVEEWEGFDNIDSNEEYNAILNKLKTASPDEMNNYSGHPGEGYKASDDPSDQMIQKRISSLVEKVEHDGGTWMGNQKPDPNTVQDGQYLMGVYVNVSGGYHFAREDEDGGFSQKHGPGEPVQKIEIDGKQLESLEGVPGHEIGRPGDVFVGYMSAAPKDVGFSNDRPISDIIQSKEEALFISKLGDTSISPDHEFATPEKREQTPVDAEPQRGTDAPNEDGHASVGEESKGYANQGTGEILTASVDKDTPDPNISDTLRSEDPFSASGNHLSGIFEDNSARQIGDPGVTIGVPAEDIATTTPTLDTPPPEMPAYAAPADYQPSGTMAV